MSSAAEEVAAASTWAGAMPPLAISSSSARFLPWGVTPLSVPMATLTPAATARRKESAWASDTSPALRRAASGSGTPASAAASTPRGATRVGTSQAPRASSSSIASSSR
jgi:hypothetical protein